MCGIDGRDYDVEKYINGIYKILSLEIEDLKKLKKLLSSIGEKFQTEFYIGTDYSIEDMPEILKG